MRVQYIVYCGASDNLCLRSILGYVLKAWNVVKSYLLGWALNGQ